MIPGFQRRSEPGRALAQPARKASQIPPPPSCAGQILTILPGDSLFLIGRRFGLTVPQILRANPQIRDPNRIFAGQQICLPIGGGGLRLPEVLSIRFLDPNGNKLPVAGGFVQLAPQTTVRVTFAQEVSHVFFFLTPTGTDAFLATSLIGIVVNGRVVDFVWMVPPATLGRLFVIGCDGTACRQSEEISVVRLE